MVPSARGHPLPLPHMRRRLDFPARWVRARFEPLPKSQGARVGRGLGRGVHLSWEGAALRVGHRQP